MSSAGNRSNSNCIVQAAHTALYDACLKPIICCVYCMHSVCTLYKEHTLHMLDILWIHTVIIIQNILLICSDFVTSRIMSTRFHWYYGEHLHPHIWCTDKTTCCVMSGLTGRGLGLERWRRKEEEEMHTEFEQVVGLNYYSHERLKWSDWVFCFDDFIIWFDRIVWLDGLIWWFV